MRILLLCHSFNSLSQRLYAELRAAGHDLSVELDINDETTIEAVTRFQPQIILAPYLKRPIPATIWRAFPCLVVHPGPPGDRGPAALDWAILNGYRRWGVTILQAEAAMDAGPVWATRSFALRPASKSELYRLEVTEAAVEAVLEAIERVQSRAAPVPASHFASAERQGWQPVVPASRREIHWDVDDSDTVLSKLRSADGNPGVKDSIGGLACRLYDAQQAPGLVARPGEIIARQGGAICRATRDGAIWIGYVRGLGEGDWPFKLPAADVLSDRLHRCLEIAEPSDFHAQDQGHNEIVYEENGGVGYLHFNFYNGAMNTARCRRLLSAYRYACSRPTRVIVLLGGRQFWSNGLDLNAIEAASSPADESWRNILAMNDLVHAIITTQSHLTLAAMQANAGAGGAFLALAADEIHARKGIVLNPHYRNMGNLYGSEYWTYLLPKRVGAQAASRIMDQRLPILSSTARDWGLLDRIAGPDLDEFLTAVYARAQHLATSYQYRQLLENKGRQRCADEKAKPLAAYREEELARMRLNFYGFDPSYHVARYKFVYRIPQAWTPLYLARHRRAEWVAPGTAFRLQQSNLPDSLSTA